MATALQLVINVYHRDLLVVEAFSAWKAIAKRPLSDVAIVAVVGGVGRASAAVAVHSQRCRHLCVYKRVYYEW